ncbi:MAG: hypothetical protein IJZ32_02010 [Clostridia bacterium]|nr:hypothetical protein [Clostridia bacterium]
MAKREKEQKKERNIKESEIVTKESLCAVCALFSALALLILFTRSMIFGGVGVAIHSFLTGLMGYLAYPILFGTLYLSVMGLIGKRLVKNRKLGFCIGLAVLFTALVVHTAITYSWSLDGYAVKCFKNAEALSKITVCGWLGGLLVFCVASAASKVGALIFFSAVALFFIYLCVVIVRKSVKAAPSQQSTEKETVSTPSENISVVEIPVSQPQANTATVTPVYGGYSNGQANDPTNTPAVKAEPVQNYGYGMPTVRQRPGVSLSEETNAQADAYSPFGTQGAKSEYLEERQRAYENSREFLFGASPAENYRKNLLFDPNAKVNQRPPVEVPKSTVTGGYTPSYSEAYQNAVNEGTDKIRPVNIITDSVNARSETNDYGVSEPVLPEPMQPIETEKPVSYPTFESTVPEPVFEPPAKETPVQTTEDRGYQRHEYMDLFSQENPNVYGDRGEPEILRNFDRAEAFERDTDRNTRDGISRFDEVEKKEDDPYTVRSDFESERGRDGGYTSSRDNSNIFDEPSIGFGRGEELSSRDDDLISDRGRAPVEPIVPQKEEPKPTPAPPKPRVIRPYVRVPLDDFDCRDVEPTSNDAEVEETKANIIATLEDFRVTGASISSVTFGPTVTRYNVTIPRNISPKKVVALDQSIAISLHSSGVNIYPNYEDGVVSIEVPNKVRQFVQLGCMLTGDTYVNASPSSLMFTMGKDVANRKVYGDISKMIHLLVAGSSGSGKSVFLGSLIISLIYKYSPEELRLILIDPKKTEFVLYNDLPHLMINEIITDVNKAVQSLNWAIGEMNRRYGLFEQMSRAGKYVVNLDDYNAQLDKANRLPKIVIIIDELADLMLAAKKEIEDRIQNLTQKARAAGIHLVVATQRPSTDVITGVIKSNLPTRIAFGVATDVDSRVILDQTGAQKLLGKGDFLYTMQGINTPVRVQSAFISSGDSQKVVNFIKSNNEAYYDEEATAYINKSRGYAGEDSADGRDKDNVDPMYIDALRYVILSGSASISMIQRKCSAGYNRAGKIIEWMEDMGYISAFDGAKARKVLITKEEFESKYGPLQ